MVDWYRDGAAAEYVAVEARNLAAKPTSIDHLQAAAVPLAGLTAWQALFDHGRLEAGQAVLAARRPRRQGRAPGRGPDAVSVPDRYEIRVGGVLDSGWSAWFDGLEVTSDQACR